jgi:hypothetical protein
MSEMDRRVARLFSVVKLPASLAPASVYSSKGFYTLGTRAVRLVCRAVSIRARIARSGIPTPLFVS